MLTSLENSLGSAIDQKAVQQRTVYLDATATLTPNQNIVFVGGFDAAVTVTLPAVGDCAGRIFAIHVTETAAVNNVTVADADDSLAWADIVIASASGGSALLFCDGAKFWVLSSTIA